MEFKRGEILTVTYTPKTDTRQRVFKAMATADFGTGDAGAYPIAYYDGRYDDLTDDQHQLIDMSGDRANAAPAVLTRFEMAADDRGGPTLEVTMRFVVGAVLGRDGARKIIAEIDRVAQTFMVDCEIRTMLHGDGAEAEETHVVLLAPPPGFMPEAPKGEAGGG